MSLPEPATRSCKISQKAIGPCLARGRVLSQENAMIGNLHSIESFGLVDGPGVRCVVFLRGCPMRCRYCHNPDTWKGEGGEAWEAKDLLKKVLRFRPYWKDNGGITVSGGEAMTQMAFVTEFFTLAKKEGVHTALDTSGILFPMGEDRTAFDALMAVTDLVILDIKEMEAGKHKALTGCDNAPILAMARYLSEMGKPMWIRHVLVPGLTDEPEGLRKLGRFLSGLKTVERFEMLPYHSLGVYKWESLGLPYTLQEALPPTEEEMQKACALVEEGRSLAEAESD